MLKKTIEDLDLNGKRVLIRVDFNVPLDEHGQITDDARIRKTLPTIRYALSNGARLILMSHLGRPDGVCNPKYSLRPAAKRLSDLLERPVSFAEDCVGIEVESQVKKLAPGEVILL